MEEQKTSTELMTISINNNITTWEEKKKTELNALVESAKVLNPMECAQGRKAGAEQCLEMAKRLKSARCEIENYRKDLTAPLVAAQKKAIEVEKRLVAIIEPEERRTRREWDAWEAEQAAEKRKIEEAKKAKLYNRTLQLISYGLHNPAMISYAETASDDVWAAFEATQNEAKADRERKAEEDARELERLKAEENERIRVENENSRLAEIARRKAEDERKEIERKQIEDEKAKIEADRKALEDERRKLKEKEAELLAAANLMTPTDPPITSKIEVETKPKDEEDTPSAEHEIALDLDDRIEIAPDEKEVAHNPESINPLDSDLRSLNEWRRNVKKAIADTRAPKFDHRECLEIFYEEYRILISHVPEETSEV